MRRRKCGPNPTDRGRCGSKLNVMTTGDGTPLAVIVSAANRHDVNFLLPLVLTRFPRLGGMPGRPREMPRRVRADAGYTSSALLTLLRACGVHAEIPQRGEPAKPGLGVRRWPVERAIAWLKQYRRVGVRRDRTAAVYEGFVQLACALIAFRKLPDN